MTGSVERSSFFLRERARGSEGGTSPRCSFQFLRANGTDSSACFTKAARMVAQKSSDSMFPPRPESSRKDVRCGESTITPGAGCRPFHRRGSTARFLSPCKLLDVRMVAAKSSDSALSASRECGTGIRLLVTRSIQSPSFHGRAAARDRIFRGLPDQHPSVEKQQKRSEQSHAT